MITIVNIVATSTCSIRPIEMFGNELGKMSDQFQRNRSLRNPVLSTAFVPVRAQWDSSQAKAIRKYHVVNVNTNIVRDRIQGYVRAGSKPHCIDRHVEIHTRDNGRPDRQYIFIFSIANVFVTLLSRFVRSVESNRELNNLKRPFSVFAVRPAKHGRITTDVSYFVTCRSIFWSTRRWDSENGYQVLWIGFSSWDSLRHLSRLKFVRSVSEGFTGKRFEICDEHVRKTDTARRQQ